MSKDKSYVRYQIEVAPSFYDLLRNNEITYYQYSGTEHLPSKPITFKDLPGNIANRLKDAKKGDSLVFVCDPARMSGLREEERVEYEEELERKITHKEYDPVQQTHKLFFDA